MAHGVLYTDAQAYPLSPRSSLPVKLPFSYYLFFYAGSTTPAPVYKNLALSIPYLGAVTANNAGLFTPIFMDPSILYRVQWYDVRGRRLLDVDPYVCGIGAVSGTSPLQIDTTNNVVSITPFAQGGSGAALTLTARKGAAALQTGTPGVATPEIGLRGATGTNTIGQIFGQSNKPGPTSGHDAAAWFPVLLNGNLTGYIPLWAL